MRTKWILALLILFSLPQLWGQTPLIHVSGSVIDAQLERPIPHTKAIIIRVSDSTIVDFKGTNREGAFDFELPIDTFRLLLNHHKYDELEFLIVGSQDNRTFELGELNLPEKGQGLDEVVIMAFKEPIYFKGDTLVYVADSFKTRPNAVVEDLLKKLPGVKVNKEGGITVQGKSVKKVLVDGDEFFGSDATLATRNLTANSIETVEIYEKAEDGAASDEEKIQVLDLKLKDEAKQGYFGEAQLGSDFNRFHEGKLFANYFTTKQKASIFAMGANTLESAISWEQMNKYGLNHLNAYQYDQETDSWRADENHLSSNTGLPTLYKTGAFYQNKINDKWFIGTNYTYSVFKLKTQSNSFSQYNFADTTYSNQSESGIEKDVKQHLYNLTIDYNIDSTSTISFTPKVLVQSTLNLNNSTSNFMNSDGLTTRIGDNSNNQLREGFNIKTPITYRKSFRKTDRKLMIVNNFVMDRANNTQTLFYEDRLANSNLPFFLIDQMKNGQSSITSNLIQFNFFEPLSKKVQLHFKAEHFITSNKDFLFSYNPIDGAYTELDALTSNDFQSLKNKTTLGIGMILKQKKHTLRTSVSNSYFRSKNENLINGNTITQSRFFVLPQFQYIFKKSNSEVLQFKLSTVANLPENNLLQPIYNNSNPNRVYLGSPNLLPSYAITNSNYYQIYKNTNNLYAYISTYGSYMMNSYVSDLTFDENGRSLETYYNKSLFNYFMTSINTSLPLYKTIISLEPGVNYTFNQTAGRVNGLESTTQVNSIIPSIGLTVDLDIVYLTYESKYNYTARQNANEFTDRIFNQTWSHEASIEFYLPWKMEVGYEFKYTKYQNLSQSFNINPMIMSARITQSFGKNKEWSVTAQIHDILNQNQSISRYNSINIIQDSRVNTIARYYLIRLGYKFNSMYKKNKKKENEGTLDITD